MRISLLAPPAALKIWNSADPTTTKRKTASIIGPICIFYYFFYDEIKMYGSLAFVKTFGSMPLVFEFHFLIVGLRGLRYAVTIMGCA